MTNLNNTTKTNPELLAMLARQLADVTSVLEQVAAAEAAKDVS